MATTIFHLFTVHQNNPVQKRSSCIKNSSENVYRPHFVIHTSHYYYMYNSSSQCSHLGIGFDFDSTTADINYETNTKVKQKTKAQISKEYFRNNKDTIVYSVNVTLGL